MKPLSWIVIVSCLFYFFSACTTVETTPHETTVNTAAAVPTAAINERPSSTVETVQKTAEFQPSTSSSPPPAPSEVFVATPTPEPVSAPTLSGQELSPEIEKEYPVPVNLSSDGLTAYKNIAALLLTEAEINALYEASQSWIFTGDDVRLYSTCRTFQSTGVSTSVFPYFFNCVYFTVQDFNLLTGDLGIYDVLHIFETGYPSDYPSVVYGYESGEGMFGIDHLVQVGRFVYITGVEVRKPSDQSLADLYTADLDQFLSETLFNMLNRALAAPPLALEFEAGSTALLETGIATVLTRDGDFEDWSVGEPDDWYENGVCRTLYHETGPPPVLINCVFDAEKLNIEDWLSYYEAEDFIDVSLETGFVYEVPYFIFVDFTPGGYPRYSIVLENDGLLVSVDLIMPLLAGEIGLVDSFSDQIDKMLRNVIDVNMVRQLNF